MRKTCLYVLVLLSFLNSYSQNKELIKVTDMLKIKSVGSVALDKNGRTAVMTINIIEQDGDSKLEYKYVNQLWTVATDGSSKPKQLTSKESSSDAEWSPDGKQIAFVRAVDSKSQIFLIAVDGGEAIQLTKFRYGASNPKWSPDGKKILFSSSVSFKELLKDSILNPKKEIPSWSLEKPGLANERLDLFSSAKPDPDGSMQEVRAYLENNATDKKAKVVNKLNFQDETDVNTELRFSHFFIVSVDSTATPKAITRGFYQFSSADFTPDGKQIVFEGNIDSIQHPDRTLESSIFIINSDGTGMRTLLGEKNKSFSSSRISPSGRWLAFQYTTSTTFVNVPVLAITSITNPAKDIKEIPFDRSKANLLWSKDERFIYFIAQSEGAVPIYKAEISSNKIEKLTEGTSGIASFDLEGNKLAFAKTEVADPSEFYVSDINGKNQKKLSDFNGPWLANKALSFPEHKTFVNDKGQTIDYWIMKPIGYESGKKYPLLLDIHGGPTAMWGPGEKSMWHEFQYFCSKGYGVVYSNPRGSGGYGLDFLRANINDWGTGPTKDVLTAVDKTVAEGWADTSKLLVTGGSYAGYLVAWIVGHDNRFKAACAQRGVYDLLTFFGEGNAWRLVPSYFGGYPWDKLPREVLERESPINYVQNIQTPLIIFHGDNDRRTGFVQSEMLYRSLKVLNKPVEYIRHPGATHELTRSGNNRQRIDQMLRTWEFFERWIH